MSENENAVPGDGDGSTLSPEATTGAPSPRAGRAPAGPATLAEMRDIMADSRGPYWSGPMAEELQRKHRELIEAEFTDAAGPPVETDTTGALTALAAMSTLGGSVAQEFRDNPQALEAGEAMRVAILDDIGGEDGEPARAVKAEFEGLPGNIKAAIYGELARGSVQRQPVADREDVELFRATPQGKLLAAEFGTETPARVAKILARFERATARLSDAERARAHNFFWKKLDAQTGAAILRRMSA